MIKVISKIKLSSTFDPIYLNDFLRLEFLSNFLFFLKILNIIKLLR